MGIKDKIDILRWMSIVEEEIDLKSDRAIVITSTSILETQLEKILKTFMIEDNKVDDRLFNGTAPLATFSAKVTICYYLGIISEEEYKNIEIIRKIRNKFAHEIEIRKMSDSQSIIDLCNNFTLANEMYIPEVIKSENGKLKIDDIKPLENLDIQSKFIRIFKNLTMYLEYRIIEIMDDKRMKYENISYLQMLKDTKQKIMDMHEKKYKLNIEYKEKLLLILEKLKDKEENSQKIQQITDKIEDIDREIDEYTRGKLFYKCDIANYCDINACMNILNKTIEVFESNNN